MVESTDIGLKEQRATTGGAIPILPVADVDASIDYYLQQLGFSLDWRTEGFASVRRDRTAIMLCQGDQGHPGTWIWMSASDVDTLYAEFESRGARLRHEPANYPWGSRECQVADLDGNVLRFGADLLEGEPMGEWMDGSGRRWLPAPGGGWRPAD